MVLGFDSNSAKHTATLVYNVFGERLYVAGRNGAPDAFEQPFHSVDFTYSWYPTDNITLKLKLQNLLDETVEIERQGVVIFEEDPGLSYSMSFQYAI
jgi:outer membrane receptor protein involved in Fe transport